ncbi:MAG: molybdopterin-dependent oxidoreductase [Clostridiales Family XIII bacterium]|jgi:aldehyde oxidoreductase|nr:molybdopterin-dependent oxidoreductase [Clostridiales Family XIII bacterium]
MEFRKIWLNVNGSDRILVCNPEKDSLADVLRRIGLTGTKIGCGVGMCGACSVLLDGKLVRSCVRKIGSVPEWSKIVTVEGIGTPENLHPLQQAWITYGGVQCGFCTPGFIVSSYALLKSNPSPTREETREWFTKNRNACRCTGWKPLVDCVMEAAAVMRGEKTMEDITFKTPADGKIYGTMVPRPAALAKVTGTCDYGDDIGMKMPDGTLHLAIVQGRAHHAKIKGIDFSEAEKMPGVVKVVTAKDIKGTNRIMFPLGWPRCEGDGFERPIINDEKVFRYGDVVAVVAATSRREAREAAAKVKVDLEPLPAYMTGLEAVAPGAESIHPGISNEYVHVPVIKGDDPREILEKSDYVVEGSMYSTSQPHMVIEPETVQAYIDEMGLVTVQSKTLALIFPLITLAPGLGLEDNKLRMIENPTGASFGSTLSPVISGMAAACALATGKPVTLTMSWEETNWYAGKRAASYSNMRLGCDKDGKITAAEYDLMYDHGAYSEMADSLALVGARFPLFGYYTPSLRALVRVCFSNQTYGTAYRSYGNSQSYTMSEPIVDMLAYKAGIDPFEFRYRNLAEEGQTNINSWEYSEYHFKGIMDTARPYYEEAKKRAEAETTDEKKRGVGISVGGYHTSAGPGDHSEVAIELNAGNGITIYHSWEDQGQGSDVGALVIAHEALRPLGLEYTDFSQIQNDIPIQTPITGPAGANRSHYMAGNAIIDACNKLLAAMKKDDGTYRTYEEMVAEGIETKHLGIYDTTDITQQLDPNTGVGKPTVVYSYMVFLAETETEVATGKTKVLSMKVFYDIGKVGSLQAVEGQAYGAMAHSIGWALSDKYIDDENHNNLIKCGFLFANDIPDDLQAIDCEGPREKYPTPHGSVGCCEGFQSAGHIAVLNAIYNATGVRILDLPASPEKVKAGLDAAAGGNGPANEPYFLGSTLYDGLDEIRSNPVGDPGDFEQIL